MKKFDLTTAELDWIKEKKIGLVLSGGGGHGFAEIGAAKILEDYGIVPRAIVGCSVGSLVGAFIASGKSIRIAEEEFTSLNPFLLLDFTLRGLGFLKGERLVNHVLEILELQKFSELNIPFQSIATNINSGKVRVFSKGYLGPALGASIAVPGIFSPRKIGTQYYADGGLYTPVPIEFLPPNLDIIIVIDVSQHWNKVNARSSSLHVLQNSIRIMTHHLSVKSIQAAKQKNNLILVTPPMANYSFFDVRQKYAKEMIKIGEQSMRKTLKKEISRLKRLQQHQEREELASVSGQKAL